MEVASLVAQSLQAMAPPLTMPDGRMMVRTYAQTTRHTALHTYLLADLQTYLQTKTQTNLRTNLQANLYTNLLANLHTNLLVNLHTD